MRKCKISECKECSKTFGVNDGNISLKMCFTCAQKNQDKDKKNKILKDYLSSNKAKKNKPPKRVGIPINMGAI